MIFPEDRPISPIEPLTVTRRYFLGHGSRIGLGAAALAHLASFPATAAEPSAAATALPHFAPRAKRVIFLTQSGGPSQLELYDEKPELMKWAGKELPESVRQGQRLTTMTANQKQLVMPARVARSVMVGHGSQTAAPEGPRRAASRLAVAPS